MRTDEPFKSDDSSERALDALLRSARFPEASLQSREQLRRQWIALRRKRRIGRVVWSVSAAAAIVVVVGIAAMMTRPKPSQNEIVVHPKMLLTQPTWRESTPAERLVAIQEAHRPRQVQKQSRPAADPSLDSLVRQLGDPLIERRFQAARELARSSSPQVVPALSSMVERNVNRREALAALMLRDDPAARKVLVEVTRGSNVVSAQVTALKSELRTDF